MTMRAFTRPVAIALTGLAAALLVSCGGSGKGLIPAARATPLQGDFEAVARAAEAANGDCKDTETALAKTEQDFAALPSTVDAGLRGRLREGISHLHDRALTTCAQTPTTTPTQTGSTQTTAPTQTTPPSTATTPTPPPGEGGGTSAQGEREQEGGDESPKGKDHHGASEGEAESPSGGESASGGTSAGGAGK